MFTCITKHYPFRITFFPTIDFCKTQISLPGDEYEWSEASPSDEQTGGLLLQYPEKKIHKGKMMLLFPDIILINNSLTYEQRTVQPNWDS